jgi:hypothetical protein
MTASVVAMVLTAWMQAGAPARAEPIDTTLCEIVKAPLSFHRKLVRISSYAQGVGIDTGPMLYDPACAAVPVYPELPIVTNDYQIRRLQECFDAPIGFKRGTHPMWCLSIKATFVGEVDYFLTIDGENPIRLKVREVSDLAIKSKKL